MKRKFAIKFRTKIYLCMMGITALSAALALGIFAHKVKQTLFKELQSKALSIAVSTAGFIDGELLKQIKTAEDLKTPAYKAIHEVLKKVKDSNNRKDIKIKYVYTVKRHPFNPRELVYGVDGEIPESENWSEINETDESFEKEKLIDHINEPYSFKEMVTGKYGEFLSSYAPVYDKSGQYAGSVGVDISAEDVNSVLGGMISHSLPAFFISLVFALYGAYFLSRNVSRSLNSLAEFSRTVANGFFSARINLDVNDEFQEVAQSMNQMNKGLEEREKLKTGFSNYVSQYVMDKIITAEGAPKLLGERRKVTIFCSDIRNFTSLSERMPPEQVVRFLNSYFKEMIEIIFKYNGTLDKFIGDGLMAEFGAPLADSQQERNAVLASLEMQDSLKKISLDWQKKGFPAIEIGIGIHTGDVIIGSIGSEQKMEYTAIGDTVNTAFRIEGLTKEYQYPVIISEATYQAIKDEFPCQYLGKADLKGKSQQIKIYGLREGEAPPPLPV